MSKLTVFVFSVCVFLFGASKYVDRWGDYVFWTHWIETLGNGVELAIKYPVKFCSAMLLDFNIAINAATLILEKGILLVMYGSCRRPFSGIAESLHWIRSSISNIFFFLKKYLYGVTRSRGDIDEIFLALLLFIYLHHQDVCRFF